MPKKELEKKQSNRKRIFNIMQYVKNPKTGEDLINEETIKKALNHKSIKKWAYILHDSDIYTEEDEKKDPTHKKGSKKPPHFHIVLYTGNTAIEVSSVAKWFGIPENFIQLPSDYRKFETPAGHGSFLDCVEYLTHEHPKQQELGKTFYKDECVISSFDFRDELTKRNALRLKYGKDLSQKEQFRYDVLMNGKTLLQCQEEDPLLYSDDMTTLKKLRLEYISKQKAPRTRINYYISGRGGLGKGLCSRALARSLFPDIEEDDEIFFIVGNGSAKFEGYDGQPVIIWDDMRAFDLLSTLGGRGNVFNVLDTHPTKQRQNIKYGSINLCNTVNIINSVQSYVEFLDGLAGEYKTKDGETVKSEDKGQSYRRMPFIINLHEEDFDLLVNKGFVNGDANFQEYEEYENIRGNFQKVRVALRANEEIAKKIESKMLELPKQKYDEVVEREAQAIEVDDDLLAQFEDYGKQKPRKKESVIEYKQQKLFE